jgi:hypothetical protein
MYRAFLQELNFAQLTKKCIRLFNLDIRRRIHKSPLLHLILSQLTSK